MRLLSLRIDHRHRHRPLRGAHAAAVDVHREYERLLIFALRPDKLTGHWARFLDERLCLNYSQRREPLRSRVRYGHSPPQRLSHPLNDYYVITSLRVGHPDRWSWEIRRKSKPLGIKMIEDGYQSETAAQFAGKRALAEFLSDLLKEEKRK